jgi:hypothetical protein
MLWHHKVHENVGRGIFWSLSTRNVISSGIEFEKVALTDHRVFGRGDHQPLVQAPSAEWILLVRLDRGDHPGLAVATA